LDREIGLLVEAGFPLDEAVHAYMTLSVYTRGCVLQHRLHSLASRPPIDEERQLFAVIAERSSLPVMSKAYKYWNSSFATDLDFETGLSIIIDGLRGRLARIRASAEALPEHDRPALA